MNLPQIALLIRVDVCHLEQAVEILANKEIGWLSWETPKIKSADNLPPVTESAPAKSANEIPENSGFVQGQGKGKGEGQGKDIIIKSDKKIDDDDDANWWTDKHPTDIANRMIELQSRINSLHPSWTKRPHFSAKELHALHENSKAWLAVEADDWALLQAFMFAKVPDEWRKDPRDFFQPDNRLGLIGIGPSSILSVADKWAKTCKRHNVPTGIETITA